MGPKSPNLEAKFCGFHNCIPPVGSANKIRSYQTNTEIIQNEESTLRLKMIVETGVEIHLSRRVCELVVNQEILYELTKMTER